MESSRFRGISTPPSDTTAYFNSTNSGPRSCWKKMEKSYKDNLELQWRLRRIFQLNKIIHLKSAPGSKNLQSKQTERDTYSNRLAEASKNLQDSK